MKPKQTLGLLALCLALWVPATKATAGEAIEALKGSWTAETFDGEAPPAGMTMVMTFVDDATLRMEVTFNGETEKEEIKYTATENGDITIFPDPEENPAGEKATWEVKADKKLYIKTAEGETLVFSRKAG
ncbi:MAG: hypothetical protein ACE37H_06420 [Phycisphaeraceae bacterium]